MLTAIGDSLCEVVIEVTMQISVVVKVSVVLAVGAAFLPASIPALPRRGDAVYSFEVMQPLMFDVTYRGESGEKESGRKELDRGRDLWRRVFPKGCGVALSFPTRATQRREWARLQGINDSAVVPRLGPRVL
jgi:hypothetical protein